ncbi:MAG: response regulator [Spirochaetes bacterium]|nr:response regulator [Spirochaetota bacterium]
MRRFVRHYRKTVTRLRRTLSQRFLPLWVKGVLTTLLLFFIPFVALSFASIRESTESEKESLFQSFYLRAHAFSLEMRTFLKDKIDLQYANQYVVAAGSLTNVYELKVPDSVRSKIQTWLAERQPTNALLDFYIDAAANKPRIIYVDRRTHLRYFIFEALFLSYIMDTSQNIAPDDRIFLYNAHDEVFLSNSIENEYHVPAEWQAGIHRQFWQQAANGIQEIEVRGDRFIIARYKMASMPLVIYLARPYAVAMSRVENLAYRMVAIYAFVAAMVFFLLMVFFRIQLRTLKDIRKFVEGKISTLRMRHFFWIRDERIQVLNDIIAIRAQEKLAILARDDAEQRSRAKADFLADMSHEIRNPLNAILGITDLLRERSRGTEEQRYLRLIRDSGDSLLRIINDVLDLSKIESNRMTLETIEFDIRKLIADLRFFYTARAQATQNTITVHVNENVGNIVLGDPTRVRQIIINLVGNALKFTQNGKVYIRVARAADSRYLKISIHDNGIGISRENIARIFNAYEQAETSTTRHYGGTGLGLSIVLRLVRLMHGTIRCRSQVGYGTSFMCRILLPEAKTPTIAAPTAEVNSTPEHLKKLKILVAEDNEINQMLMIENLTHTVHELVLAKNGIEAVEIATAQRFDLIFMDIVMPELDGLEATKQIRAMETTNGTARTPIVALSGNAMAEDIAAAVAVGCDMHLAKPVRKAELIGALLKLCPAKTLSE